MTGRLGSYPIAKVGVVADRPCLGDRRVLGVRVPAEFEIPRL